LRRRLPLIAEVEAIETRTELEALLLESKLVKRYLPEANSLLRDFHDYPFVKVDMADPYPRLEATRERPTDGTLYFGPFRRAAVVSSAVTFLNEQLGLRQCSGRLTPGQSACALLEMKKCLGPCVGAVSEGDYAEAVDAGLRVLRGQENDVLTRACERRDGLAEAWRFEEAAELRDRIRDVEAVVAVQQRLSVFSDRHVVLVTPDRQPDRRRVLLIRGGRLIEEVSLQVRATPAHLRYLLRRSFTPSTPRQMSRAELDDVLIIDAWIKRHRADVQEVPVDLADPAASVPALRAALLAGAVQSSGESGATETPTVPTPRHAARPRVAALAEAVAG
jgi:excinuclease UvrABC nuclease subunit